MARRALAARSRARRRLQRGQSATEFVIVVPVLLLIILSALQLGLLYRAKSTLNLAAFQAARAGALHNGREGPMQAELANGLAGLYAPGTGWNELMLGRQRATTAVSRYAQLTVVNPPASLRSGRISNQRLKYQNASEGGLSLQDLNVLKIKVVYCHPLQVPFISTTLRTLLTSQYSGFERQCLADGRMPLASSAVVRMHTDYCPEICR